MPQDNGTNQYCHPLDSCGTTPQDNFGFPAMEGLEADVVMKCIWEQLQV